MIRRRDDNRGPWYLLTGLVIGLAVGLLFSWVAYPVKYVDTAPFSLRPEYKDQYRSLIAAAYQSDGDLGRARARLALLQDSNPLQALVSQAQRGVATGQPAADGRALAVLAAALGQAPGPSAVALRPSQSLTPSTTVTLPSSTTPTLTLTATASQALTLTETPTLAVSEQAGTAEGTSTTTALPAATATPSVTGTLPTLTPTRRPSVTSTPRATDTPRPTRTATQTVGPPFVVADQKKACDATNPPLLEVQVNDGAGKPVPGVQVIVTWDGGQDSFFTGLKPDVNPGYADFAMTVGTVYTLRLADGGEPVNNLSAADCGNPRLPGGWLITFKQP